MGRTLLSDAFDVGAGLAVDVEVACVGRTLLSDAVDPGVGVVFAVDVGVASMGRILLSDAFALGVVLALVVELQVRDGHSCPSLPVTGDGQAHPSARAARICVSGVACGLTFDIAVLCR